MAMLREEMGGNQWDPTAQMQAYLSRIAHVSGRCRLSRAEEMLVLELCQVSAVVVFVQFFVPLASLTAGAFLRYISRI